MARTDASSMFPNEYQSLLDEEEIKASPSIVGPSSREALGLSKFPVRNIPIADIVKDSDVQFRTKIFDPEHDEEDSSLLATMGSSDIGLLQPIMVQETEDAGAIIGPFGQGKKYQMVFGHRRLACARYLGWEKIQAHVAKASEDVLRFTLTENSGGKTLTPYEKAVTVCKYLKNNPDKTHMDIAKITGWDRSYVSKLLTVVSSDTPSQIQDLFAKGLSMRAAISLTPVFIAIDPSDRDQLARSLTGCSTETAELMSKSVQQGMDPSEAVELYCSARLNSESTDAEPSVMAVEANDPFPVASSKEKSVKTVEVVSAKPVSAVVPKNALSVPVKSANFSPRLPSGIRPENDAIVEAFALENGTTKALVKMLIKKAITLDLDREELENSCLISANCNDADLAVCYLTIIMADSSSYSAFRQYARSVRLTLKAIYRREKDHSFDVAKALREGVFNPRPLVPGKSEKNGQPVKGNL